jgi:hypothetical protein
MRLISILLFSLFSGFVASKKIVTCIAVQDECVFRSIIVSKGQEVEIVADYTGGSVDADIKTVKFEVSTIHSIPAEIFTKFVNLQRLEMYQQKVEVINPGTFMNASRLEHLELSLNLFQKLGAKTFVGAENLKAIYFDAGKISDLNKDAFSGLQSLEFLYLFFNNLKFIHPDTFKDLKQLKKLGLDGNQLEFLPKNLFAHNPNLDTIFLNENRLNALANNMFSHLRKLSNLWLNGNRCISKSYYNANSDYTMIEEDLKDCSIPFLIRETAEMQGKIQEFGENLDILNGKVGNIENMEEKIDRKFEEFNGKIHEKIQNFELSLNSLNETVLILIDQMDQIFEILANKTNDYF